MHLGEIWPKKSSAGSLQEQKEGSRQLEGRKEERPCGTGREPKRRGVNVGAF